jgi:beta-mannosidase
MLKELRTVRIGWLVINLVALSSVFFGTQLIHAQTAILPIDSGWQFRQRLKAQSDAEKRTAELPIADWLPATVPGDVHLDLLAQKLIPDPFFGTNEAKLQWISDADWEYQTTLNVTDQMMKSKHMELVFDGLDGYAQVYLNGALVVTADNQFRVWRVDAMRSLHSGANRLSVVFPAQDETALAIAEKDPWFPRNTVAAKSYLRKAAYEHGWDWGPTFVTVGVWKAVRLEMWNTVRIRDFYVRQQDVSESVAHLSAELDVSSDHSSRGNVECRPVGPVSGESLSAVTQPITLEAGLNHLVVPLEIKKPQRWFPAGYGQQPLYTVSCTVNVNGVTDEAHKRVGLRSLELRRDLDQWGRSFEFVVNGIPVFAKGADVIPSDSFANRVTPEKYRAMLQSAKDANMNIVRLWGGGYYETDEFYDLCDELGLMVWHDFMFGNEWQPGDYGFEQGVAKEAEDQLVRLRNHPSIVLWNGNNETELAFHWQGRDNLPSDVRLQMWQDYLTLFDGVLARTVARFDPEVPYWPSSPSADFEATTPAYTSGDEHIWDVWHGRVPFETYQTHHPRFVSEYGFQSFPDIKTIRTFTTEEDRASIFTPVMLAHQKNGEGNSIIKEYMLRDYPEAKDFDSFIYVSQVLQAEGIKLGTEHFRRERPLTMGTIFWQLNDCWPVASWSSIDSEGRWKALQFYAKRFYAPVLVSPFVEDGALQVSVVSDRTTVRTGSLDVKYMNFGGKVLFEQTIPIEVQPLSSSIVYEKPLIELSTAGQDLSQGFVVTTLTVADEPVSEGIVYLLPTKQIKLPPAHISMKVQAAANGATLLLHTDVLARSVQLTSDDSAAAFDDNFFDMLPGETRSVRYNGSLPVDKINTLLHVRSLSDAFPRP